MRYVIAILLSVQAFASVAPSVGDAKVIIRSRYEVAGSVFCGFLAAERGGGGNGVTFSVATKGSRLFTQFDDAREIGGSANRPGAAWIVNFDDQETYRLQQTTSQYSVQTFGQVLRKIATEHKSTEDASLISDEFLSSTGVDLPAQSRRRARRFEHETSVRDTGQRKTIAGHATREIVLTITAHERGKTLEGDGGWVATSTIWLSQRLPHVDHLVATQRRYIKAVTQGVYDAVFTETELNGSQFVDPCWPEHVFVGARVIAETEKLDGTVLASTTVYEMERTPREYQRVLSQFQAQQRRMNASGARVLGGAPPKRSRQITMELEFLSVSDVVTDADVSIPLGVTRKK